jgi:mRNA deadenylase 3'-5' endonuclease subunit Ccr4
MVKEALQRKDHLICLMIFNILYHLEEASLPEDYHWSSRARRIALFMELWRPDIICLQEPQASQVEDLKEVLGPRYHCFTQKGSWPIYEMNSIFYAKDQFDELNSQSQELIPFSLEIASLFDIKTRVSGCFSFGEFAASCCGLLLSFGPGLVHGSGISV